MHYHHGILLYTSTHTSAVLERAAIEASQDIDQATSVVFKARQRRYCRGRVRVVTTMP